MNKIRIWDVDLDVMNYEEVIEKIMFLFNEEEFSRIATPNPEIMLKAREYKKYRNILMKSDINIMDGAGLVWACRVKSLMMNGNSLLMSLLKSFFIKTDAVRVSGTGLMEKICMELEKKVFLIGAREGIAQKAASNLKSEGAKCDFVGYSCLSNSSEDAKMIVQQIKGSGAEIVFVAFGAPNQEYWIDDYVCKCSNIKLAIGVGGAFDFLSGEVKRAPGFMRKLSLEWLWRLFSQPKRIGRIFNAVVVFPYLFLRDLSRS